MSDYFSPVAFKGSRYLPTSRQKLEREVSEGKGKTFGATETGLVYVICTNAPTLSGRVKGEPRSHVPLETGGSQRPNNLPWTI